jgi:nucleoside-diphosphate-sugar epimerase
MRVFIAGATGAIGRQLVPQLVQSGHEVTGMTRSEGRAEWLKGHGAHAFIGDVYDVAALESAVAASAPEVVIDQLTALPASFNARSPQTYAATNRLRREGTRNLIAAAQAAGARRLIAQSIAFLYTPEGGPIKDEEARPFVDAPAPFDAAIAAALDLEHQVTGAAHLGGVVLRYGYLYGPGTGFAADGPTARAVRQRRYPLVGTGGGIFSFLHVTDAAGVTLAAVERGEPGIYNAVDDDPAAMRDWLPVYAQALGAPPPQSIPEWVARALAGSVAVYLATELRGAANAKAKRDLGWAPRYGSWRAGFSAALG